MKFRLKITLLSLLISGALLVGFGLYFLGIISRVQMDRVDREIWALGNTTLRHQMPREFWRDVGQSMQTLYGDERSSQLVARVLDAQGRVLYSSPQFPREMVEISLPVLEFDGSSPPGPAWRDEPEMPPEPPPEPPERDEPRMPPPPPLARMKKPVFQTVKTSDGEWRVGILGNETVTMMIGVSLAAYHRDFDRVRNAFLVTVPLGLLVLAAGGWLLATHALRPVALITRTAQGITARGLDKRIPITTADADLARLVEVINGMLDRLEKSFQQAVRFSADAAHELQTPLTVLQGELEQAIQTAAVDSDEQQRYGDLLEEVQRLKAIVQKLLLLARADAGQLALHLESVDLTTLLEDAIEDVKAIAPELEVQQHIPARIRVMADADLLAQAIRNMTSNAVKYNCERGRVRFELETTSGIARFTLSNTGTPIPEEDRERVFDRFYRVDKSRSRRVGGAGLGLSLAREIARAHHGDVVLNPVHDDLISFTLTLPLADASVQALST
ncbi:MAG: ATP-binding protein [Verrucomicrobiia bacterium]|jgi:heavy metal sensor kinase